jgi:hypothetical protein
LEPHSPLKIGLMGWPGEIPGGSWRPEIRSLG